jgi:hypothetical protein
MTDTMLGSRRLFRRRTLLRMRLRHAFRTLLTDPWWIAVHSMVFFVALILAAQLYSVTVVRVAQADANQPLQLDLTVKREREALVVRWAGASLKVSNATHGVLNVLDGKEHRAIPLTRDELQLGVARYVSRTNGVSFTLAIYDATPRVSGTTLFVERATPPSEPPVRALPFGQSPVTVNEPRPTAPPPDPIRPKPAETVNNPAPRVVTSPEILATPPQVRAMPPTALNVPSAIEPPPQRTSRYSVSA